MKAFAVKAEQCAAIVVLAVAAACSGEARTQGITKAAGAETGTQPATTAAPAVTVPAVKDPAVAISVGEAHACAITKSGDAQCWGMHNGSLLGDGSNAEASPVPVRVAGGHKFIAIAAGAPFTCAIDADGQAFCWGGYDGGQLGGGKLKDESNVPKRVVGDHKFKAIAAGMRHVCALDIGGSAWCWGANEGGQLGAPAPAASGTPTQVVGGHTFTAITASKTRVCAAEGNGAVWCWGGGGMEQRASASTPKQVAELARAISLQGTCAVDASGAVHCIGDAAATKGDAPFTSVATNGSSTCALVADGTASCWGLSADGHLGVDADSRCTLENATSVPCATHPLRLRGTTRFSTISLGSAETYCGVALDGQPYCWGLDPSQGGPASNTPRLVALKP